jgi:hypothetical protein
MLKMSLPPVQESSEAEENEEMQETESVEVMEVEKAKNAANDASFAAGVENANYSSAKITEEVAPPCHQTMDDSEMEEFQEDGDKKVDGND